MRSEFLLSVTAVGLLLVASAAGAGQQPPPIHGVTGTMALEGTITKTSGAGHTIVVKTADGIDHLIHLTDRTAVHGGTAAGDHALRGLEQGSTVVVHYTAEADTTTADEVDRIAEDGLNVIEGVITKVDRHAKTISIQLADGSRQTLQLTERAASDVGKDLDGATDATTATVVIYFNDEAGRRVAHFFKRRS